MIIDAHEDLAYNSLLENRDYILSVPKNRKLDSERSSFLTSTGWSEMQKGNIGIVFGTIFLDPPDAETIKHPIGTWYEKGEICHKAVMAQLDFYHRWCDEMPEKFCLIENRKVFHEVVKNWQENPPVFPEKTNPVGLIILWEGAEGLRSFEDLDLYYERGVRLIGPVWHGGRWCGGSNDGLRFTDDGRKLLDKMADKGFILDLAHMNTVSTLDALDLYPGTVVVTHADCRALLKNPPNERQMADETIERLIDRNGVMGVLPFNGFLNTDWKSGSPRSMVTLRTLADHIDHICQIAGDARHAAIGTDMDGGFGYPDIPEEMNDISDIGKLGTILAEKGYKQQDIDAVFYGNWARILEDSLS